MGVVIYLVQCQLKCSELSQVFMLQLDPPGKRLPDGTSFDTSFTTVSEGVLSNVPPLSSCLQYTSSDGIITPVSRQNYSNNIVVADDYF